MADGVLLPREFTARETIIAPETKTEMDSLPVAKESGIANQVKFMQNVAKIVGKKCIQLVKKLSIGNRKGGFDIDNSPDEQNNFTSISYNLILTINDQSVTMTIDSGIHNSIVNISVWHRLGEPPLEPVTFTMYSSSGTRLKLKGQFMANVNYAGRVYQLPLIVSEQPDIDNLLGRRWLPALHLDWNRIFHCIGAPQFQPESDNHRQLALKMTDTSYSTDHYYVNVNVHSHSDDVGHGSHEFRH